MFVSMLFGMQLGTVDEIIIWIYKVCDRCSFDGILKSVLAGAV